MRATRSGTRRPRRHFTRDDRRRLVDAWRHSGCSQTQFAREHGITASHLSRWRLEFPENESGVAGPMLLEVFAESSTTRRAPPCEFQVRLPSGIEVAIPADFDGDALHRLIATLMALPC